MTSPAAVLEAATFVRADGGRSTKWQQTKAEVQALQRLLIDLGFPLPGGDDGDYATFTIRAVADYQGMQTFPASNGQLLDVDGKAGPLSTGSMRRCVDDGRRIAPHFRIDELRSKGSFPWPDGDRVTIGWLERIRTYNGRPIRIISGHRAVDPATGEDHNAAVGGSPKSEHKTWPDDRATFDGRCTAVDIQHDEVRLDYDTARNVIGCTGGLGIVRSTGWIAHIDNGEERHWFY